MEYVKGEVCGVDNCRARQYYVEDGLWFCKNGHRKAGRVQTGDDDAGTQASGTRITRKAREAVEKPITKLKGKEAFRLQLRCFQLVLQKQIYWLVHTQGLPAEIEAIAKGLWTLRLQKLTGRADGVQEHQSQSEAEGHTSSGSDTDYVKTPDLADTICICYLSSLILRLPYTVGDFHRWIMDEEIIYFRAIRYIPEAMRSCLDSTMRHSLDTKATMPPDRLLFRVRTFLTALNRDFGIEPPSINVHNCLFGYIVDLALPLDVYRPTIRLGELLNSTFTYPLGRRAEKGHLFTSLPEVHLMTLVVITVKLIWGFDGLEVQSCSATEPAATRIDWQMWQQLTTDAINDRPLFTPKQRTESKFAAELDEQDMLNLEGNQLDRYLDWYQQAWIPDAKPKLSDQLQRMFLVEELKPDIRVENSRTRTRREVMEKKAERVKMVVSSLLPSPVAPDDGSDMLRPGSRYVSYPSVATLTPIARQFYSKAAEIVAVKLETLVKCVVVVEKRLDKSEEAMKQELAAQMVLDNEA